MLGDKSREVGQKLVEPGVMQCDPLVLDSDLVSTFLPRPFASFLLQLG